MRTLELANFIQERHAIYIRRIIQKKRKPWTDDPILQQYKFCNIFRELDTVTQWITKNWREPNQNDPQLWFALTVARLFNLPRTLEHIGFAVPFDPKYMKKRIDALRIKDLNVFNAAYIVSTNGISMDKVDYVLDCVLKPMWIDRAEITDQIQNAPALKNIHKVLTCYNGIGSFISGQIIADLKYAPKFKDLPDWWSWAASGPGSRRGLNRVMDQLKSKAWKEVVWLEIVNTLQDALQPILVKSGMPRLHAQDLQNCLCEFDKYERVRLGEGRPKQLFNGRG